MEPITRKEKYLAKLNGQDINIDPPITNEEYYLAYLCGEDYGLPTPVTLDEMYLAAMCGVIYVLPMPITRLQRIWKQLIETGESDITPGTREELYWVGVDLWDIVYSTVSGNPVMFTAIHPDLLKQLKVAFAPVQDLHGYDAPWPAGGGKNLWNPQPYTGIGYNAAVGTEVSLEESTGVTVSGNQLSYAVAAWVGKVFVMRPRTAGTYHLHIVTSAITNPRITIYDVGSDNKTKTCENYTSASAIDSNRVIDEGDYVVVFIGSNTAQTIEISDPQLEAGSSFTSFVPYSNLCPISGWSEVTVEQRGKNLFDKDSAQITDGWWSTAECTVGEPLPIYAGSGNFHTSAPIPVIAGQTYIVVGCGGQNGSFLYLDKDMNYLDGFANLGYSTRTFTVPNNPQIAYLRFPFSTATVDTCQLELGSTASPYQPYNGRSISISLGQTVYSGYVDVISGVGEVTMASVDMGSLGWLKYGDSPKFYASISDRKPTAVNTDPHLICSSYPTGTTVNIVIDNPPLKTVLGRTNSDNIIFADSDYSTVEALTTAMSGVQLVYELATPIPIQLTPQEVQSLLGENVMWSDANGNLTVEYRSN